MIKVTNFTPEQIAREVVSYCQASNKRFVYISGNGGSGKSEFCKIIGKEAGKKGHVNILDMDDFVVDTALRKSGHIEWEDKIKGTQTGSYSTSFAASYFLQNIKAIICNLSNGNNYYHWPKKAKSNSECRLLYAEAVLTVIEGVGSVFLNRDKDTSIGLFMQCNKEIEIDRRVARGKFSNEKNRADVLKNYEDRNSQFEANILPFMNEFDIVLKSLSDYSLSIERDDIGICI